MTRDAVLERLAELPTADRADRVYRYVETEHDVSCTPTDILWALRSDDGLSVELRDSGGRSVLCALQDTTGEARYPLWEHQTSIPDVRDAARRRSIEELRDVKKLLETRQPRFRLRENTPLADIEAPDTWPRRGAQGEVFAEP
jgi:hypothetical protein